ncbi:hypothetical protein A8A54_10840 [Brucella pseudogrignonensis]|nr:hypothetical protein A8A54_10840 [Brucella pseudogrignonensis]
MMMVLSFVNACCRFESGGIPGRALRQTSMKGVENHGSSASQPAGRLVQAAYQDRHARALQASEVSQSWRIAFPALHKCILYEPRMIILHISMSFGYVIAITKAKTARGAPLAVPPRYRAEITTG